MDHRALRELFAHPPASARLAPFWFLNHELREEETRWQVGEMQRQGVGGFVLHARHGLLVPYMGEQWMANLAAAIDEARRRGMKVYLYDENNWPSGPADGKVFEGYPQYRMSGLYLRQREEREVDGAVCLPLALEGDEELVAVVAVPVEDSQAAGFPASARLLNEYLYGAELRAALPPGRWRFFVFTRRYLVGRTFFGTYLDTLSALAVRRFLELTHVPYGERFGQEFGATVEGIFTDEPTLNFNPPEAAPWTAALPGEFGWRKGYELLTALPALFEDLGPATAKIRCDFYDVVSELYAENFFGQLFRWCTAHRLKLMGHPMNEGELVEHARQQGDWFRVMRYMHWGGVDQLCELTWPEGRGLNNLAGPKFASSASHLLGKPRTDCECFGLASQWGVDLRTLKWLGDWLACLGVNVFIPHAFYYSIQGFRKWECPPGEFYQSAFWPFYHVLADHLARLAVLLRDGQHVADVAFLYPIRSMWAELAPHATPTAWYLQDHFNMLGEALLRLNYDFDFVSEEMLQTAQVRDGRLVIVDDQGAERESFKLLVLPALTTISRRTVEALERVVGSGVRVLATGTLPTKSSERGVDEELQQRLRSLFGEAYDSSQEMVTAAEVRCAWDLSQPWQGAAWLGLPPKVTQASLAALHQALSAALQADVQILTRDTGQPATDVIHYHWRRAGLDFYVIHNTSRQQTAAVRVELGARGEVTLWDPDTGQIRPAPIVEEKPLGLAVPLDLPPVGTLIIGLDPGGALASPVAEANLPLERLEQGRVVGLAERKGEFYLRARQAGSAVLRVQVRDVPPPIELAEEWEFCTDRPNALPLLAWQLSLTNRVAGRDHASAAAEYRTRVTMDLVPPQARLLLDGLAVEKLWAGTATVPFEVLVNGTRVPHWQPGNYLDHYLYEAEVGQLLRPGENEFVVRTTPNLCELPALRYPLILIGRFSVADPQRPHLTREPGRLGLQGWHRAGYPFFSGLGFYRQVLRLPRRYLSSRLWLEMERVGDAAEVVVNGCSCGVRAWEPWRVEITPAVVPGRNTLEIRVANSLQNLLVQEPKPSGLLGKVRIVAAREVSFALQT
jgi:hypothetical protein